MQISKKNELHLNISKKAMLVSLLVLEGDFKTFEEIAYNADITMKELDIILSEISQKFCL